MCEGPSGAFVTYCNISCSCITFDSQHFDFRMEAAFENNFCLIRIFTVF